MPPFEGAPYGGLLGLGSGSKRSRDRGFFWKLAADGSLEGEPVPIDLQPLYDTLRAGDRGAQRRGRGGARRTLRALSPRQRRREPERRGRALAGAGDGLAAGRSRPRPGRAACGSPSTTSASSTVAGSRFSDATALTDDLVVFTASAEGGGSSYDDGSIHGSVVGTIDSDGDDHPAADDRPQVEGRGRSRLDRRRGDRLRLRLRPGRSRRALASAQRHDARRRGARRRLSEALRV